MKVTRMAGWLHKWTWVPRLALVSITAHSVSPGTGWGTKESMKRTEGGTGMRREKERAVTRVERW